MKGISPSRDGGSLALSRSDVRADGLSNYGKLPTSPRALARLGIMPDKGVLAGEGIKCPTCASVTHRVTDSRPVSGTIRRYRICPAGHIFKTVESA